MARAGAFAVYNNIMTIILGINLCYVSWRDIATIMSSSRSQWTFRVGWWPPGS